MKHRSKKFSLIFSVLLLIAVVFAYVYARNLIGQTAEKIIVEQAQMAEMNITSSQNVGVTTTYKDTAEDRAKLKSYFVPQKQVVDLIEKIESFGKEAGGQVAISSIDGPKPIVEGDDTHLAVKIHVAAQGSWSAMMRVLTMVQALPYATAVDRVRLSAGSTATKSETKSAIWAMTFEVQALTI